MRIQTTNWLIVVVALTFATYGVQAQETAVAEKAASQTETGSSTDSKQAKTKQAKPLKTVKADIARGLLNAKIPEAWKQQPLRSRIIEHEFAIPPVDGDKNAGRMTMMASGGTVKMNIDRWYGQFTQSNGKPTKDVSKVTEKKIGDLKVSIVDISGNFKESIGPPIRRKTVDREDYRMLGAIVQAKPFGSRAYFIKLYGPKKTMAAAEKPFMAMIDSLSISQKPL